MKGHPHIFHVLVGAKSKQTCFCEDEMTTECSGPHLVIDAAFPEHLQEPLYPMHKFCVERNYPLSSQSAPWQYWQVLETNFESLVYLVSKKEDCKLQSLGLSVRHSDETSFFSFPSVI